MTTPDPLSDVVERGWDAWRRFFHPSPTDFADTSPGNVDTTLSTVLLLEVADCLRLSLSDLTRLREERAQHSQWVDDTVAQMKLCNRRAQDAEAALAAERERVKALAKHCYTISESEPCGYRVVIGFQTLADAQVAQAAIVAAPRSLAEGGE